jgi:hypothetical protein
MGANQMQDGRNSGVIPDVNAPISLPSCQPRSRLSDFFDVYVDAEDARARQVASTRSPDRDEFRFALPLNQSPFIPAKEYVKQ